MATIMANIGYQRVMDGYEKEESLYENANSFHGARPGNNWKPYKPQTKYGEHFMPADPDSHEFWSTVGNVINHARASIDMRYVGSWILNDWHDAGCWLIEDVPNEEVYVKVLYKMYKTIVVAEAYAKVAGCSLREVLKDAVNKRLRVRDPELQKDILDMLSLWQAQWEDSEERLHRILTYGY